MKDFIEVYPNALTKEETEELIYYFERNDKLPKKPGRTGGGVAMNKKKSLDCGFNYYDPSDYATSIIKPKLDHYARLYDEKYYRSGLDCVQEYVIDSVWNLQKYEPGEGYFYKHCEASSISSSNRVLVWMFYLNDVKDGGTIFPTVGRTLKARRGNLVIWPAYWMWNHHGQISRTKTKYVATGWFIYRPGSRAPGASMYD